MTINHDEIRKQHVAGVIAAVRRKHAKSCPANTPLVVRIDDATPFRDDKDLSFLREVVEQDLLPLLSGRGFCVFALVGLRGAYLSYGM